jgi:hypothetical protein
MFKLLSRKNGNMNCISVLTSNHLSFQLALIGCEVTRNKPLHISRFYVYITFLTEMHIWL